MAEDDEVRHRENRHDTGLAAAKRQHGQTYRPAAAAQSAKPS